MKYSLAKESDVIMWHQTSYSLHSRTRTHSLSLSLSRALSLTHTHTNTRTQDYVLKKGGYQLKKNIFTSKTVTEGREYYLSIPIRPLPDYFSLLVLLTRHRCVEMKRHQKRTPIFNSWSVNLQLMNINLLYSKSSLM